MLAVYSKSEYSVSKMQIFLYIKAGGTYSKQGVLKV
jgi:hypothetical protein